MPLKITHLLLVIVTACCSISYAQTNKQYDCRSIAYQELLDTSFASFEKDLFAHYDFGDPIKSYKTFLNEVYTLSLNLRKLPSTISIQSARTFKKNAVDKNALWVLLSVYDDDVANQEKTKPSKAIKDGENVLTFNYRGGFIQCLKNNSKSQGFKDIVETLEADGNVSPSLIAQLLATLPANEFDSYEVKSFIAFDIYYSILLIVEKAFP